MRGFVPLLLTMGPKEIQVAIFSPPVQNPCIYGIDMPSARELITAAHPPDEPGGLDVSPLPCRVG